MSPFSSIRNLPVILLIALMIITTGFGLAAGTSGSSPRDNHPPVHAAINDFNLENASAAPDRQIMQVIDNKLYSWYEYIDYMNQVKSIYLLEPYEKALSSAEAIELLNSSRQWEEQVLILPPEEISPSTRRQEDLDEKAAYYERAATSGAEESLPVLKLEGMEDRRSPVTAELALTYPYNNIGFLNVTFPDNFMRSTAFLIGPNLALTNAHNIYSPELGGWYESIDFSLAQYENEWPHTTKPYSTRRPVHVETNEKFFHYENEEDRDMAIKYDYAVLFFEKPYSEINTFMPVEFNHIPDRVQVIGYPGYVRNIKTNGLWKSEGKLIDYNEYCLYYDAYTSGGNSGSPVLVYRPQAETYRIVAIHAFASPGYFSGGPHFNVKNQPVIEKWLQTASGHIKKDTAASITLNQSSLVMKKGEREALVATTNPEYLQEMQLTWSSSNPEVAEVTADGIITALSEGETVITLSLNSKNLTARCKVLVEAAPEERSSGRAGRSGLGDLNDDGVVNVLDVILVLQHILEIKELDAAAAPRADVNGDDKVDIQDAALIMRYALGLIENY